MKARGKREARRPWYMNQNAPSPEKGVIYFGPSGLVAHIALNQGRRASRLPLAFIFRAFGASRLPLAFTAPLALRAPLAFTAPLALQQK